jgi:hypothetical protein
MNKLSQIKYKTLKLLWTKLNMLRIISYIRFMLFILNIFKRLNIDNETFNKYFSNILKEFILSKKINRIFISFL